jgi:hypothetical protein
MPAVIAKAKVASFDAWLNVFETNGPAREAAGMQQAVVWQEDGDPNSVVVLIKVESLARARGFFENPELKSVMDAAGIVGTPEFTYLDSGRKLEH